MEFFIVFTFILCCVLIASNLLILAVLGKIAEIFKDLPNVMTKSVLGDFSNNIMKGV